MSLRTDLICEQPLYGDSGMPGVIAREHTIGECKIEQVDITNSDSSKMLKKEKGRYFTLSFRQLDTITDTKDIEDAIVYALTLLLPPTDGNIMVVGLGNRDITPDALGPFVADKIIATRHLQNNIKQRLGLDSLKSVSVLVPGVLGKTGMEASLTVASTAKITGTRAVIVIDALAASETSRLCTTVQLTNTGISPGSGVKNSRKEISHNSLNIPVIAIGIPTVTDVSEDKENTLMVTPKEIDLFIKISGEMVARALNRFLQPYTDSDIITALS